MALCFVGLLVLLLWLRRPRERIYGAFAALALVWSLRNFHYFVAVPWLPAVLWEALVLGSLGLALVLNWIFMRRYTGLQRHRAKAGCWPRRCCPSPVRLAGRTWRYAAALLVPAPAPRSALGPSCCS
jgi:hypothetical protein